MNIFKKIYMNIIKKVMKKVENSLIELKEDIKHTSFIIETYQIPVEIWYGDWKSNIEIINRTYNGLMLELSDYNKKSNYSLYLERNDGAPYFIILLSSKNGILHESLHITWYISEICGIKLSWDNHEAQAYLLEYLNNKIYSLVQNY